MSRPTATTDTFPFLFHRAMAEVVRDERSWTAWRNEMEDWINQLSADSE